MIPNQAWSIDITYIPIRRGFLYLTAIIDWHSRWADNIMIERWFRSFKYEEAYLTQYNNIKDARTASDSISILTTLNGVILHLTIRHRLNATIRQCCCHM